MKKRRLYIVLCYIILIFCVLTGVTFGYLNNYYHADENRVQEYIKTKNVTKSVIDNDYIVYLPSEQEKVNTAFIFYPGGKVEYTAYEPLMQEIASNGVMTILIQMPYNLAVLDYDAADGIQEKYPSITSWYMGGHSLGGAMAAKYVSENVDAFKGLCLFGSYSTNDLSETNLNVLLIHGSNDRVMTIDKYEASKSNYPSTHEDYVIEGGNHAYYGMYGEQSGDGEATISNEEQITIAGSYSAKYMLTK